MTSDCSYKIHVRCSHVQRIVLHILSTFSVFGTFLVSFNPEKSELCGLIRYRNGIVIDVLRNLFLRVLFERDRAWLFRYTEMNPKFEYSLE